MDNMGMHIRRGQFFKKRCVDSKYVNLPHKLSCYSFAGQENKNAPKKRYFKKQDTFRGLQGGCHFFRPKISFYKYPVCFRSILKYVCIFEICTKIQMPAEGRRKLK
jgi:hypothetical protein